MKTFLIFFTIMCFCNFADAMTPHADNIQSMQNGLVMNDSCKWLVDDAKWFFTPHAAFGPQDELVQIEVIGNTLIGDRTCAILGVYRQNEFLSGSELTVFYEKENEKVYFVEEDEFKLLFDFSNSFLPGDTISSHLPRNLEYYDISSSSGDFIPSSEPLRYRNAGQELITLSNGEQIRVVNTELVGDIEEECFVRGDVIDGIGSVLGLMGENCMQLTIGFDGFFRCFQSNTLNYTAIEEGCFLTSVDEISETEVSVYPNPTNGQLNITTEITFSEIKVFDLTGKLLLDQNFSNEIDVGIFAAGIYFLELTGKNGVFRKKIIKE